MHPPGTLLLDIHGFCTPPADRIDRSIPDHPDRIGL